jgi:hypothetical protein
VTRDWGGTGGELIAEFLDGLEVWPQAKRAFGQNPGRD